MDASAFSDISSLINNGQDTFLVEPSLSNPIDRYPLEELKYAVEQGIPHPNISPLSRVKDGAVRYIDHCRKNYSQGSNTMVTEMVYSSEMLPRLVKHLCEHLPVTDLYSESMRVARLAPLDVESIDLVIHDDIIRDAESASTEDIDIYNRVSSAHFCLQRIHDEVSRKKRGSNRSFEMFRVKSPSGSEIKNYSLYTNGSGLCSLFLGGALIHMSFDVYLMIMHIIKTRYNTLTGCVFLHRHTGLTPTDVNEFCRIQDKLISDMGNTAFDIIKSPEALAKAYLAQATKSVVKGFDCYNEMVKKYREKADKSLNPAASNSYIDEITEFIERPSQYIIERCLSIFGLIKLSGHPILDYYETLHSAAKDAKAKIKVNENSVTLCVAMFKKKIVVNYIAKHHSWPPLDSNTLGSRLEHLYKKKARAGDVDQVNYIEFRHIRFFKFMEFNYYEDYTELLQDKSCAVPKSKILGVLKNPSSGQNLRRLLLEITQREVLDIRELMKQYSEHLLSDDERVIFGRPKEREMKSSGRCFSMQTPAARMVFACLQENTLQFMKSYFPYTSMSLSSAETIQKLMHMTKENKDDDIVTIEIDFSRWNGKFRHELQNPVESVCNEIFGTPGYFGRQHEFFIKCIVLGFHTSKKIDGFNYETGEFEEGDHEAYVTEWAGGHEGICQRQWTITTALMILCALEPMGVEVDIIGQGDNQIVGAKMSNIKRAKCKTAERFCKESAERIDKFLASLGHEVKPEENLYTINYTTYGKKFFNNGIQRGTVLKSVASLSTTVSSELPSIIGHIGALSSGVLGIANNLINPVDAYPLYYVQSRLFVNHVASSGGFSYAPGSLNPFVNVDDKLLRVMLNTPSIIGGFPVVSLTSYICSSEPDPLTAAIAVIKRLSKNNDLHICFLNQLLNGSFLKKDPTLDSLVLDPYSIPLNNLVTQASLYKTHARSSLNYSTREPNLKEALSLASNDKRKVFMEQLIKVRPFYPLLLRKIYDCSVFGAIDKLCVRFVTSRTFIKKSLSDDISSRTESIEAELRNTNAIMFRFLTLKRMNPEKYSKPTDWSWVIARRLRKTWKCGVESCGLESAHPLDFTISRDVSETDSGIFVLCDTNNPVSFTTLSGRYPPMLEQKTGERRSETQYTLQVVSSLTDVKDLVSTISMIDMDENMRELVYGVLASRTNLPYEYLIEYIPRVIGGSMTHRLDVNMLSSVIRASGLPGPMTHICWDTNRISGVSGSKEDYAIMFPHFFMYIQGFYRGLAVNNERLPTLAIMKFTSSDLPKIGDEFITLNEKPNLNFPPAGSNPMVHVSELKILSRDTSDRVQYSRFEAADSVITQNLMDFLTSMIFYSATRLGLSDVTKKSMDEQFMVQPIGTVEFNSVGGEMIFEASVRALIMISAAKGLTTIFSRGEVDMNIGIYMHSSARLISSLYSKCLFQRDARLEVFADPKFNLFLPSDTSMYEKLARIIANEATSRMTRLDFSSVVQQVIFIPKVVSRTTYKPLMLFLLSSIIAQTTTPELAFRPTDRVIKDYTQVLMQLNRTLESFYGSEGTSDLLPLVDIMRAVGREVHVNNPIPAKCVDIINRYTVIYDTRTEPEMIRCLRQANVELTYEYNHSYSSLFLSPAGTTGNIPFNTSAAFGLHSVSQMNPDNPDRDEALLAVYMDKMHHPFGTNSSAGVSHIRMCLNCPTNVAVVGSGAGGIQSMLASLGKHSTGFDLSSTKSIVQTSAISSLIGEIAPFNAYASTSLAAYTTSGDFFDEEVRGYIESGSFDALVVDIETGSLIDNSSIIEACMRRGLPQTCYVKVIVDDDSLTACCSFLAACHCRVLEIFLSLEHPDRPQSALHKVFIKFWRPSGRTPHQIAKDIKATGSTYNSVISPIVLQPRDQLRYGVEQSISELSKLLTCCNCPMSFNDVDAMSTKLLDYHLLMTRIGNTVAATSSLYIFACVIVSGTFEDHSIIVDMIYNRTKLQITEIQRNITLSINWKDNKVLKHVSKHIPKIMSHVRYLSDNNPDLSNWGSTMIATMYLVETTE
uniref:RNA-directed RNA polymerase n=1 Tax=Rhizoctonia cerealis phyllomonavirus TaxID=3068671 RepID=A0AA51BSE1_9MONO|nr:MAG: RNA-dependent RNA polymerase [Rhizoctonia cerealis phyllomonavirus]